MNRQQLARFQKRQAKIIRDGERSRGYNVRSPRYQRPPSKLEEFAVLVLLMFSIMILLFI